MASTFPTWDVLLQQAIDIFKEEFKELPAVGAYAPGRVNLIGEHTDYNDGFVLPMALPMVTVVVGKKSKSHKCQVMTNASHADLPHKTDFLVPYVEPLNPGLPKWANYVKGVVANFKAGTVPGFKAVIVSSVPFGGGLSSSAALEVAIYTFLEILIDQKTYVLTNKALACQKAEHDFAGMPCGIMDQFVSVLAQKENALLIDCRSLEYSLVPFKDPSITILIANTNVKHELSGSEYPTRRRQCHDAAKLLGRKSLREAKLEDLEVLQTMDIDEAIVKRARHVISEIKRTQQGATALISGDFKEFGRLMYESHVSLKDDYEVSCDELDQLVEAAMEVEGVLGSRMTGGGFGGCTVSLVHQSHVNRAIDRMTAKYSGATFYIVSPENGTKTIVITKSWQGEHVANAQQQICAEGVKFTKGSEST